MEEIRTSCLLNRVKNEYIICSAIHYDNGIVYEHKPDNIETGFVVCGRRHSDCVITVANLLKKNLRHDTIISVKREVQGFLTSRNRFLNRKEAWKFALEVGQIESDKEEDELFSEDLY